jgi:type IV secretory pathway VirB2 component (pilin)
MRTTKDTNRLMAPALALAAAGVLCASPAAAQGLEGARTILETFKEEILGIVPIVAVIALVLLGVGYAMRVVDKDTFIRWGFGCIIAGGASGIASMIFNGAA